MSIKMTNKCPFCGTPAAEHEAGRCLDHWVETVKCGYSKARLHKFTSFGERGEQHWESFQYYDEHDQRWIDFHAKHRYPPVAYSKDLNAAITLWPTNTSSWRLSFEPKNGLWAVAIYWTAVNDYMRTTANDPALAIGRAYLITNLKEI